MLTKQEKGILRSRLFRHLDGIVMVPSAYALKENGVTNYLLTEKSVDVDFLAEKFDANAGYLNVALRALCSQGWLTQHVDNEQNRVRYEVNESSETAFGYFDLYKDAAELLHISEKYHPRKFEMAPFLKLEDLFQNYQNKFGIALSSDDAERSIQEQILMHIEGVIVGPTLVHLGMTGMFHKYFMESRFRAEEFHKNPEGFERLLNILTELKWFTKHNGSFGFTEEGLFFARRASAYGVTVSYIPTLRKLNELIFGDPDVLRHIGAGEAEQHVDREMNVWGSGGAHSAYFKVVDEMIIDIFNKPINEQPKGILDMGCGNGAFLKHLFYVIEGQTLRGTMLEDYPLTLIGVDYNEAALKVSRENLIQAEIWAKIIWGDIGDPAGLAKDLDERYGIDLKDVLNVRTFLDHNRIWEEPKKQTHLRISSSTGAFVSHGKRLDNNLVSESLREHFNKWMPFVEKFGLLLIELHSVKPELVSKHLGKTASTAYEVTHGYSDQYILEMDEFMTVMQEVGLAPDDEKSTRFPDSDLASISVNLFRS